MANVNIDRLTLRLSAVSTYDAERLARRIADKLSTSTCASADLDSIRVSLPPAGDIETLSDRVVEAIARKTRTPHGE
jgi:hypothetical protein